MALRNVLTKEDPALYKTCRPVTEFNHRLHQLLDDMADTLAGQNGVGLAAPQVGVLRRAVIVLETNVAEDDDEYLIELINPEIIEESDDTSVYSEGCLSLPGISENVVRPKTITIRYLDEDFKEHEETFTDFKARIVLHEYDHLEAHVFTDRISPLRRQFCKNKLTNIAKGKTGARYKYKR